MAQLEHMDRADAAERMARGPTCQGWNTARTQPAVSAVVWGLAISATAMAIPNGARMSEEDQERLRPPQGQAQPGIEQEMPPEPAPGPRRQGTGKLAGKSP